MTAFDLRLKRVRATIARIRTIPGGDTPRLAELSKQADRIHAERAKFLEQHLYFEDPPPLLGISWQDRSY
jgi:hypothetical protein